MGKGRGSGWLKNDYAGASFGRALDPLQQVLALKNAVILRTENLKIRAATCGRLTRTVHLLDLEIIVLVRYR
jgi:hypothetical protein